tara:strand:+ start:233 stop:1318 length:1086 start_codon:yes stop_codon:yes gene_type:complete
MKKVIHIVGARPNFIKAAPLVKCMSKSNIQNLVVHTGQHYDHNMSQQFFDELNIPKPDYNLGIGGGSHAKQTANIMIGCEEVFLKESPDCIIVYGDVNSCVAATLVAKKLHIRVIHIESGLRSFDMNMPEEVNRIITDSISDVLFVTCQDGIDNLLNEGITNAVHLVGNTMIDSLVEFQSKFDKSEILSSLDIQPKEYILSTLHRPSNVDDRDNLLELMDSMRSLSKDNNVVFPIHPRTKNNLQKYKLFDLYNSIETLKIIEPLGYIDFMCLQKNAKLIITDSGGIQEESSFFNVPCLTVRDNTERPVTIKSGTNKLIGADYKNIPAEVNVMDYNRNSDINLWDGNTSERIVSIIQEILNG